jgi:hypothetical protein
MNEVIFEWHEEHSELENRYATIESFQLELQPNQK